MPAVHSSAPGKIILFGEHAVVYGRAAIAIPVLHRKASAYVMAAPSSPAGQVIIDAPDIKLQTTLENLKPEDPFSVLFSLLQKELQIANFPALKIRIKSDIPIASGLGSGTAVSVAAIRAMGLFLGKPFSNAQVSAMAFEVEKIYHGTPSGIDNTVITYAKPIYYVKGQEPETVEIAGGLDFLIASSGIASATSDIVAAVRKAKELQPAHYEYLFDEIGKISKLGKKALRQGDTADIGELMNRNHKLLTQLGVSSDKLERMISAANQAGASGSKLSGAGIGGNIISLVPHAYIGAVEQAVLSAGAAETIVTSTE